jgi:cytochrome c oxidase cbb3-type subunit I
MIDWVIQVLCRNHGKENKMPIPYIITALLYTLVALFVAADASFVSMNLLAAFPALRWVRVHFITLGLVSQVIFGLLPLLVASLSKKPRPSMRWDIWLTLNAGFVTLVAGFAGVNHPMIFAGGTLIFIAATLLFIQLWNVRGGDAPASLKFYITGIFYLLVGIIIGTGLWLNWSAALYIEVPLEAHIHANSWGFMSLVFAGLLVDFVPMVTGRPLGEKNAVTYIYWGMTLGAFGLVLGPWLGGSLPPTVLGLVLHLAATIWLVVLMIRAFRTSGRLNYAGAWHLVSSYLWILAPVLVAPLILLGFLEGGPIEATAPQALIYGWVLQFSIALIPFIARRFFLREENPKLGGCWGSLAAATLGSVFVWVSIFIIPARGVLYGIGFALYALALIHPVKELFEIARDGLKRIEA